MSRYEEAKKIYEALGVDTEEALGKLKDVTISVHCWQGKSFRWYSDNG